MKNKYLITASVALALSLATAPTLFAFSDITGAKGEKNITNLQDRGVITGVNEDFYQPGKNLTYAQAVTMFDRAFNLSLDAIRFIKMPEISDIYDNMKDKDWYASSFIDAYYNGIAFDREIKPGDSITREEFAHFLIQQIDRLGDYPLIKMYVVIQDQNDINEEYSNDIQKLLLLKLAELTGEDGKFNPKEPITREEAAIWLDQGLQFVDRTFGKQEEGTTLKAENVKIEVESADEKYNKVTISADVPHPGYGLKISKIEYIDQIAFITLELTEPNPEMMYPQVITNVTVTTNIDKNYSVEIFSDN